MNHPTRKILGLAGSLLLLGGTAFAADSTADITQPSKTHATQVEGQEQGDVRIRPEATKQTVTNPGGAVDTSIRERTTIERERVNPDMRGEDITVTGRIVDLTSYLTDGEVTSYDPAKLKAGEAPLIGLLTDDGRIHLVLNTDQNSELLRSLKNRSGDKYTVTGHRMARGGLSAIKVKSASVGSELGSSVNPQTPSGDAGSTIIPSDTLNPSDTNNTPDPNTHNDGKQIDTNIRDRGPASTNTPALKQ